jgi:hypothetical protein
LTMATGRRMMPWHHHLSLARPRNGGGSGSVGARQRRQGGRQCLGIIRAQCAMTTVTERTMMTVHNGIGNEVNDDTLASSAVTRLCDGDDSGSAGVGA